jgi:sporulation protein YlmC with PRC-barrel domain
MKGYVRASRSTVELPHILDDAAGRQVVCQDGKLLGHVTDIVFDENHAGRAYLEIESDRVFEISHKHFLAPVEAVELDADPIVVSMVAREIAAAPGHDHSLPFSEEYEMALLGFWGTQLSQAVEAVRDPLVERPGETHSMRPEQFDSDPEAPHSRYRMRQREG